MSIPLRLRRGATKAKGVSPSRHSSPLAQDVSAAGPKPNGGRNPAWQRQKGLSCSSKFTHDPYLAESLLQPGELLDDTHLNAFPEMSGISRRNLARYKNQCTNCVESNSMCIYLPPRRRRILLGKTCLACDAKSRPACSNSNSGDVSDEIEFVFPPTPGDPERKHVAPDLQVRVAFLDDMLRRGRIESYPPWIETEGEMKGTRREGHNRPKANAQRSTLYRAPANFGLRVANHQEAPFTAQEATTRVGEVEVTNEQAEGMVQEATTIDGEVVAMGQQAEIAPEVEVAAQEEDEDHEDEMERLHGGSTAPTAPAVVYVYL
ncbi:hypothetical protein PENSPDRAFT_760169 [Peniophora sp. CONT]|nr:hypothetical protein PENSPDRAFT_760169 [Peniophora sp. CONT]